MFIESIFSKKSQLISSAYLNNCIIDDLLSKLKKILFVKGLGTSLEQIINTDEKECHLNLHENIAVYTEKISKRLHSITKEHGKSVTIVARECATGAFSVWTE